jgi:hypothetical protein
VPGRGTELPDAEPNLPAHAVGFGADSSSSPRVARKGHVRCTDRTTLTLMSVSEDLTAAADPASVRQLLAAGADPNHVVREGELEWSVLCFAAMAGHAGVVDALLSAGADPTWANHARQTAASVAFDHRQQDVARRILAAAPRADAGFGAADSGLRMRAVVRWDSTAEPARVAMVTLELQRTDTTPVQVEIGDPTRLTWSLERDGVQLREATSRLDLLCCPEQVVLAPGDLVRWVVPRGGEPRRSTSPELDVGTLVWSLPAHGELRLACSFAMDSRAAEGGWSGRVSCEALPPIRNPATD